MLTVLRALAVWVAAETDSVCVGWESLLVGVTLRKRETVTVGVGITDKADVLRLLESDRLLVGLTVAVTVVVVDRLTVTVTLLLRVSPRRPRNGAVQGSTRTASTDVGRSQGEGNSESGKPSLGQRSTVTDRRHCRLVDWEGGCTPTLHANVHRVGFPEKKKLPTLLATTTKGSGSARKVGE